MSKPIFEGAPVYEGASYHIGETYTAYAKEDENVFQPIDLSKKEEAPPYEPVLTKSFESPKGVNTYESYDEEGERGQNRNNTGTVIVGYNGVATSTADMFHFVSIFVVILSLFVSPLIELIPMFMLICFHQHLKMSTPGLHIADLIITIVVSIIYLLFIIIFAVFTYGIGVILLLLMIPYIIVICFLSATTPNTNQPQIQNF